MDKSLMEGFRLAFALMSVVALSGCSLLTDDDDFAAKRKDLLEQPRAIVYNTDGCDVLYWPTNKPVSVEAFKDVRLKYVLGTRIGTVSYCPQSAGFGHFTCRKAGEPLTNTVTALHNGNPAARNAASDFFALGTDALDMASEFCRSNNLEIFVSIRVNDQHDCSSSVEKGYNALFPPFKKDHPEFLMGDIDRSKNTKLFRNNMSWSCVDFTHREVREKMKSFVREFMDNYDVDGIEYDFNRHLILFKSVAEGGVASEGELALMTELMRDLRAITEEAGKRRGKPILVFMRAPDSVGFDRACGIDLERWFKEKLVDGWIGAGYFQLNPWTESVALAHRHGVKFFASIDESRIERSAKHRARPYIHGRESRAAYAARFAAATAAGADGVYLFNLEGASLHAISQIDPYHAEGENKLYFARERGTGGYEPGHWLKGGKDFDNMPQIDPAASPKDVRKFKAGEKYAFTVFVGDDFTAAKMKPRVSAKVLTNLTEGDSFAFGLNGKVFKPASFKDGLFVYDLPANDVVKGGNAIDVKFPSQPGQYTLNDFVLVVDYK